MKRPASTLRITTSRGGPDATDRTVGSLLRLLRNDLQMDVAFVAEFIDGQRVFRYVDTLPDRRLIEPGQSHALEESLCQRIVDGRAPALINDVVALQRIGALPVLPAPITSHIGVPVRLQDGQVYGTLCCFSLGATTAHGELALKRLQMSAEIVARLLDEANGVERAAAH